MDYTRELNIERLNGGDPILSPGQEWWESGVTLNAAATYLRDREDRPIIEGLLAETARRDLIAVHYRARPRHDPESPWNRSFIGLAIFSAEFEMLKRYNQPVLSPSESALALDHLGVEDPRITRIDDAFFMAYCGVSKTLCGQGVSAGEGVDFNLLGNLCLARSLDLIHWERLFVDWGSIRAHNNKDVVLFPIRIRDRYYLLHRPYDPTADTQVDFAIHLARSRSILGPWEECGMIMHSLPDERFQFSWVGAGSVPIDLGRGRFLMLYHTGHRRREGDLEYDVGAAILDLNLLGKGDPQSVVTHRVERIMAPRTESELVGKGVDSVSRVIFPCGSFTQGHEIRMIYGATDSCVMAAKLDQSRLMDILSQHPNSVRDLPTTPAVSVTLSTTGRKRKPGPAGAI